MTYIDEPLVPENAHPVNRTIVGALSWGIKGMIEYAPGGQERPRQSRVENVSRSAGGGSAASNGSFGCHRVGRHNRMPVNGIPNRNIRCGDGADSAGTVRIVYIRNPRRALDRIEASDGNIEGRPPCQGGNIQKP